jgi:hypothetical protein
LSWSKARTAQVWPSSGGLYTDPSLLYEDVTIQQEYDGIVFINEITAARPTQNALRSAARGTGF